MFSFASMSNSLSHSAGEHDASDIGRAKRRIEQVGILAQPDMQDALLRHRLAQPETARRACRARADAYVCLPLERPDYAGGIRSRAMAASMTGGRACPTALSRPAMKAAEHREALKADAIQPAQFAPTDPDDRRRGCRDRDTDRACRSSARPIACRVCRRRLPRRPPAHRSAARPRLPAGTEICLERSLHHLRSGQHVAGH